MKIAKKIYYDLATGNVIQETGEMQGSVRETTIDEDFISYTELAKFSKNVVGVIRLEWGQHADKFGIYAYHIDLVTKEVVFDPTPIQVEQALIIKTQAEEIDELKTNQTMIQEVLDIIIMGGV